MILVMYIIWIAIVMQSRFNFQIIASSIEQWQYIDLIWPWNLSSLVHHNLYSIDFYIMIGKDKLYCSFSWHIFVFVQV